MLERAVSIAVAPQQLTELEVGGRGRFVVAARLRGGDRLVRAERAEFPEYYSWYAIRDFTFNEITQSNRNKLLWRDSSVDGLKTGHTEEAGYCLVSSAERDGMRVVSVVLGTASEKARADGSQALINYVFRFFETRLLFAAGEEVTNTRVWKSANETSRLGVLEDLYITVRRGSYEDLDSAIDIPTIIEAPLSAGQPVAELRINFGEQEILRTPLRALEDNPRGSFWQRTVDSISLMFE